MTRSYAPGRHRTWHLAIALAMLMLLTLAAAPRALAWTVTPADESLAGTPGSIVRGHFQVEAADSPGRTFRVVAQDITQNTQGAFDFITPAVSKTEAGTWAAVFPSGFTGGSKQPQTIDYAITVPNNATPGDHIASITVDELPSSTSGNLGVIQAIGMKVFIRVPGAIVPGAKITQFTAPSHLFSGGGINYNAQIVNTGNTVLNFSTTNKGSGMTVGGTTTPLTGLLFPGATRDISFGYNTPPVIGRPTATLSVLLGGKRVVSATASTLVLPLVVILAVLAALIALAVIRYAIRRRKAAAAMAMPPAAPMQGPPNQS